MDTIAPAASWLRAKRRQVKGRGTNVCRSRHLLRADGSLILTVAVISRRGTTAANPFFAFMEKAMFPEWLKIVLFVAGYVVLMRWVLPGLGVSTCMMGGCRVPQARTSKEDSGKL